ncbi:hypothetical protein [Iamia sp.]|uniref:hypothetical protein n=1 Tax=Iamia sp. TaxID=2722710 RepID=UPI002C26A126|nr:hypothetical protein [Iamia sp.]HXH57363.1 hypothetical protein [Iamia sp.]
MSDAAFSQNGMGWTTVSEAILGGLDGDTMAALNERVSINGEDIESVARDYLEGRGLLG